MRTTAPKIFTSLVSEGRKPYKNTMSLIICRLTTATSSASVRELCETVENAADFKAHLKMISFAVFFTLPLYMAESVVLMRASSLYWSARFKSSIDLLSYQPMPPTVRWKSTIFSAMLRRTRRLCRFALPAYSELTLVIK